jgi:hypothetical protein
VEPGWALVWDSGQGGGVVPELGIGPWKTLPVPGSPVGLTAACRFRYRLIGFLNCVQVDFNVNFTAGGTWNLDPMDADCHVSTPNNQPRFYTALGSSSAQAAGQPYGRITFGLAPGAVAVIIGAGGGVLTLNVLIPRD